MADTSVSFKCPNCTGPLSYMPGQSEIVCEYCGTRLSVADLEAYYARKEEQAAKAEQAKEQKWNTEGAGAAWSEDEQKMLRAFQCPSCGAEIVTDDNTMATECCYCGNPTMISARYEGALRPDYVIPFQKTRDEAKEAFRAFYEGKRLLPDNFLSDTRIDSIQGMYVPFWLFDSCVTATGSYRAKTVRTYRRGNCEVTEAEYYECQREGSLAFSKVPVDGSRRMDDTWMESIGPYDYSFLQPFTTSYLAGYLADRYDVAADEAAPRAQELVEHAALGELEKTVTGYTSFEQQEAFVTKDAENKVSYAMAPVWILTTRFQDEPYTFLMNGQSGKFVGKLPIDEGKCKKYTAGAFVVLLPVFYFLAKLVLGSLNVL